LLEVVGLETVNNQYHEMASLTYTKRYGQTWMRSAFSECSLVTVFD